MTTPPLDAGLALIRDGRYFEAHEELETRLARGAAGGARLPPGTRPRRRRLVPGRPREPERLRPPAREGDATARSLHARPSRRGRRRRARPGRGGVDRVEGGSLDLGPVVLDPVEPD